MEAKLKNKLLVLGVLLALFIVYRFAITNTIEAQKTVRELNQEKGLLKNISNKISNLKEKEAQLDAVLKKKNISINNSFQQTLLQNLSSFAKQNNLQIIAFNEPHIFNSRITELHTYSFEIKGNFNSLLKMVNHLENLQLGQLISIKFEKKKNFKTNIIDLSCKVLLQKVNS
ncbi:hypothetical protein [Winogradskyella sp.]|uniref:hypothetical protein n=1 Tax=Winogradskyella sp. TaxID=1883156 RepID=UPI003AB577D5